jgi:hypothetical protein
MIAGLNELDSIFGHDVDQPMLLRESSGPRSGSQILQRLRLPNSREWIAKDRFDEIERTKRDLPFIRNPEAKVFPKFGMEHGDAHDGLLAFRFVEPELPPEFLERLRFQFPALSSGECSKKPLGVLR